MKLIPVTACNAYGIGAKTITALQKAGYWTAASLVGGTRTLPFVGPAKKTALSHWVSEVRFQCSAVAEANCQQRVELQQELAYARAHLAMLVSQVDD